MASDGCEAFEMRRQSVRRPVRFPYENKLGFGRGNALGHPSRRRDTGVARTGNSQRRSAEIDLSCQILPTSARQTRRSKKYFSE